MTTESRSHLVPGFDEIKPYLDEKAGVSFKNPIGLDTSGFEVAEVYDQLRFKMPRLKYVQRHQIKKIGPSSEILPAKPESFQPELPLVESLGQTAVIHEFITPVVATSSQELVLAASSL